MQFNPNQTVSSQIVTYIKDKIFCAEFACGEKLPAIRELAIKLSVNPNTVAKAFAELEQQGLIFTESTNGKYVTSNAELILAEKTAFLKQNLNENFTLAERYGFTKKEIKKCWRGNIMVDFKVENLTKHYGKKLVLNDISFELQGGQIVGVFGLNGVGKTTLFNCIADFVGYTGEISKQKQSDISYMCSENLLFGDKTINGMLSFYKDFFKGFDIDGAREDINRLKLDPKKLVRRLSMGQKTIVSFVLDIHCSAKLYLFDEPMTNLDIIYREFLIEKLLETIDENRIYLISSHELYELENVFSHIMIIKDNVIGGLKETEDIKASGQSVSEYYKEVVRC